MALKKTLFSDCSYFEINSINHKMTFYLHFISGNFMLGHQNSGGGQETSSPCRHNFSPKDLNS
jgi:hypothetical protein